MITIPIKSETEADFGHNALPPLIHSFLAPFPLVFMQPILAKMIYRILQKRPELFNRLGPHKEKLFLIDPEDLPFVFVLKGSPDQPSLRAYRRHEAPETAAQISGTLLTLMDLVDGQLDGDALFFARKLHIEGNTEAVVCLRNALDDLEGSVIEDIAHLFGPVGRHSLSLLRKVRHYASV